MISSKCDKLCRKFYLVPRVFSQKGFDISIFGHFFCPFSQNFFDSCAKKIENNKIILCNMCVKNESIMVTQKSGRKKLIFWPKKKLKKRHH